MTELPNKEELDSLMEQVNHLQANKVLPATSANPAPTSKDSDFKPSF